LLRPRVLYERVPYSPHCIPNRLLLLSKQTVFRLKQDPQAALAALDAWGL